MYLGGMNSVMRARPFLEALDRYVDREGTARVPTEHLEDGVRLGPWVSSVRQRHHKGTLDVDLVAALEQRPGWVWGPLRPGPESMAGRNDEIRTMRANGASLRDIGEKFNLSRQRVHQIVASR